MRRSFGLVVFGYLWLLKEMNTRGLTVAYDLVYGAHSSLYLP